MDRKWENVEFEDFIGHLKSTQGHLCFQSGAEEPLFTISLYDFSCKYEEYHELSF